MPPRARYWPPAAFLLSPAQRQLVIITHQYKIEKVEGADAFRIRSYNAPLCPTCGSLCLGYDTRSRRAFGGDGQATFYLLRRVRCPSCDVLHIELPDFTLPRKHYTAAVINAVLDGSKESCPAEASTMWRWRRENHPPGLQCLSSGIVVQSPYSDKKGDE